MSGNLLVRFDEGEWVALQVSPSLLLYRLGEPHSSSPLAIRVMPSLIMATLKWISSPSRLSASRR